MEAIAGAAVALAAVALWRYRHRLIPHRGRRVECCWCGGELPVGRAVRFEEWHEHDAGGSGVVTEFHKRCLRKARKALT